MATVITHAIVATALGQIGKAAWRKEWTFWCAAILCSILPDLDVIGLYNGVPYGALWGHRGMTHSLLFAAIIATLLAAASGDLFRERWKLAGLLFCIIASHGVLDAMTNGGLGVAFFSPFNPQRYFLPWRPLAVSPIGGRFFSSSRGAHVLWTEMVWIWMPTFILFG